MAHWFKTGVLAALGLGAALGPAPTRAQAVRERDTTITGPRGNSLTRDLKSVRGPGFLERETTIHRPGGATFSRDTILKAPGGGGGMPFGGGGPHFRPGFGPGFRPGPVIVGGGGGGIGAGLVDFGLGALAGGVVGGLVGRATAPTAVVTPAPVVVGQPVMVAPGPVVQGAPAVVQAPPTVVQAAPTYPSGVQQVSVVPPDLAAAIQRLQSPSEATRRDACVVIGKIGDDRGVTPLFDRLKYDKATSVRVAAAIGLGQIGDPKTEIILQRAVLYDKKQEVRDAATAAIARIQQAQTAAADAVTTAPAVTMPPPAEHVPPPPTPAFPN